MHIHPLLALLTLIWLMAIGVVAAPNVLPNESDTEMSSPHSPIGLHFRPEGARFGDAIPFFWKGVYHVFYLKIPEGDGPVCWGHLASSDLVHWQEMPDAITESCLTGSVIERDGAFHAFYTAGGVSHATSRDLVNWEPDPENPVVSMDQRWYDHAWRDPHVFWNPQAERYWMVLCSRTRSDGVNPLVGCVALAESKDLREWTVRPPLWTPQLSTCIECPDIFPVNGRWALVYFWHETRVRLADSPDGPWLRPPVQAPDSFDLFAGKTMWDGKRRILIGTLPRRPDESPERRGGGHMLIPREWRLLEDGSPATRCPPEVKSAFSADPTRGKGAQVLTASMSEWRITENSASAEPSPGSAALACWPEAPEDCYLHAEVRFAPGAAATLFLRCEPSPPFHTPLDEGYGLHLDPVEGTVSLRRWYRWEQWGALATIPFDFPSDRAMTLDVFLDGHILEVFLDDRRSLVHRLTRHASGSLGVLARDGAVSFESLTIRTLPDRQHGASQAPRVSSEEKAQTMFYLPEETGRGWDTWWFFHDGVYYQYVLSGPYVEWDGVTLLTSEDGVRWENRGRVLERTPEATYMGSGSVWKSPDFERDGRFIMNFSEQYPPDGGKFPGEQVIYFAQSRDLVHWTRLPDDCAFHADERWYERMGARWDCIYAVPHPEQGYYGYWTGFPKSGAGRAFGYSRDGVHWKALPPAVCPGKAEVAGVEKIAGRYYMISQGRRVFVADQPEGPFTEQAENSPMMHVSSPFPRFFRRSDGEAFITNYMVAAHAPDKPVYCAPLKRALIDSRGVLRAAWWQGNDALKAHAVPAELGPADADGVRRLEHVLDTAGGCVIEASFQRPPAEDSAEPTLYIGLRGAEDMPVALSSDGAVRIGALRADAGIVRSEVVDLRLLLKDSLLECYVNDVLADVFSMPHLATGRLGISGEPVRFAAWESAPAAEHVRNQSDSLSGRR